MIDFRRLSQTPGDHDIIVIDDDDDDDENCDGDISTSPSKAKMKPNSKLITTHYMKMHEGCKCGKTIKIIFRK